MFDGSKKTERIGTNQLIRIDVAHRFPHDVSVFRSQFPRKTIHTWIGLLKPRQVQSGIEWKLEIRRL